MGNRWNLPGFPGTGSSTTATPRKLALVGDPIAYRGPGLTISGTLSNDAANSADVTELQVGKMMGKVTATGKYAPSVIGVTGVAYAGSATQMNFLTAATVTELVRRMGASGTFKLTGPPAAGGVVRTKTITFSATGGGTPVNEVQTLTPDIAAASGTYTVKLSKTDGTFVTTAAVAYGASTTTLQAAITLALGGVAGWVVSTAGNAVPFSSGPIALVLTASGTGYAAHDMAMCSVDVTLLTGTTAVTAVETTKGVPAACTVTVTAVGAIDTQVITPSADPTVGQWIIEYTGSDGVNCVTAALAYHVAAADIQIALRALHTDLAAVTVTGTLASTVTVAWPQTGTTAGLHNMLFPIALPTLLATAAIVSLTCARTVTGANGDFIAGSLVQPTDGSETIKTMIGPSPTNFDTETTDRSGAKIDVPFTLPVIGGQIDVTYIVDYPTDTSLIAYVKAALRAPSMGYHFSDDL